MTDVFTTETWRPLPGYEGYYSVSSFGRVQSHKRKVRRGTSSITVHERFLSPVARHDGGHLFVNLSSGNGVQKNHVLRELVATTFIGPIEEGETLINVDGNRANNRLDNLRYVDEAPAKAFYAPAYVERRHPVKEGSDPVLGRVHEIPGGSEFWVPLWDYEDTYEISNHGNVRRLGPFQSLHAGQERNPDYVMPPPRPVKISMHKGGLRFRVSKDGMQESPMLGRSLIQSFFGPIPLGVRAWILQAPGLPILIQVSSGEAVVKREKSERRKQLQRTKALAVARLSNEVSPK